MFGFLVKLVLLVVIALGTVGFVYPRLSGTNEIPFGLSGIINQTNLATMSGQLISHLGSLVGQEGLGPQVMGTSVSSKGLEAIMDTLKSLPSEDLDIVRGQICLPASSSSQ